MTFYVGPALAVLLAAYIALRRMGAGGGSAR